MYYTYVLYSIASDKNYIGQTKNLDQRLATHNSEQNTGWTSINSPWKLVYSESFPNRQEAMKREKELKSYQGRKFIRETILPNR